LTGSGTGGRLRGKKVTKIGDFTERRQSMADRMKSPAYEVLRASSRRLLLFIETEIARQGGGSATIYPDQFRVVGSIRIIVPGLDELNALGLLDVLRYPKRAVCKLSDRWRHIASRHDAVDIADAARAKRPLPVLAQPQPEAASVSACCVSAAPENARRTATVVNSTRMVFSLHG
jgi:hypothetical protein